MSHNSIDYFATLGRQHGDLACKRLLPIGVESDSQIHDIHPSEIWSDAITDIEVIYKGRACIIPLLQEKKHCSPPI